MRDDFANDVKKTMAARVNNRCSNPACRAQTSGPQVDPSKSLNVGVAAHITAASPDGPRYNPSLTQDERKHANNAIWLCQTCGKLIDNDQARFTEGEIRHWKARAEAEALAKIGKSVNSDSHLSPVSGGQEESEELLARVLAATSELTYS